MFDLTGTGFFVRLGLSMWVTLLAYNVMFGIDKLRRMYVDMLRMLYAVSMECLHIVFISS